LGKGNIVEFFRCPIFDRTVGLLGSRLDAVFHYDPKGVGDLAMGNDYYVWFFLGVRREWNRPDGESKYCE
jgi:hypothetical protein